MDGLLRIVETTLDEVLPPVDARPAVLSEAMRYAVGTGGKRIRPLVCLGAAQAVGARAEEARYPAAAIEILHNYTLVHDDLPAMDNDVERRGSPTVWKRFGEANAILAGDALLALAYRVAAKAPRNVREIVDTLGEMGVGVVRGQVEDIDRNAGADIDYIYRHKTADLFIAAAKMGALAGGGSDEDVRAMERYALNLGLAFQYEDDLLDGDGAQSRAELERRVADSTAEALAAVETLAGETRFLRDLAKKLVGRTA